MRGSQARPDADAAHRPDDTGRPPALLTLYDLPEVDWWYRPSPATGGHHTIGRPASSPGPRRVQAALSILHALRWDLVWTDRAVERATRRGWHRLLRQLRRLLR